MRTLSGVSANNGEAQLPTLPPLSAEVMRRVKEIYDARLGPAVHQLW